jgi:hypothetical protein
MGHYCEVCQRDRANERFTRKGHKNNICKDCASKVKQQAKKEKST